MAMTIQEAIDTMISSVPGAPFSTTVCTGKAGVLKGMVVTFLATCEVIEKAIPLGANFIFSICRGFGTPD
jgi:hypothetical protein